MSWNLALVSHRATRNADKIERIDVDQVHDLNLVTNCVEKNYTFLSLNSVSVTPSFRPLLASFDFEDSLVPSAVSRGNATKAKRGKKSKSG